MKIILEPQKEYELLDAGQGEKLERYGDIVLRRPDPESLWQKTLTSGEWSKADAMFARSGATGKWMMRKDMPKEWNISFGDLKFSIRPTSFKHTGLFPEQLLNWQWMESVLKKEKRTVSVLNLFAYTGGATLACAKAGAEVCHVDASKSAVSWARENAELSGLADKPIRWIIDDVLMFLKREKKRGKKYDAIVMDPPAFGHGPKDEIWKIEEHFLELITLCREVLSDDPLFVLINGYTAGYSPVAYENVLADMMNDKEGTIETGELLIKQSNGNKLLPCGIFARWEKTS